MELLLQKKNSKLKVNKISTNSDRFENNMPEINKQKSGENMLKNSNKFKDLFVHSIDDFMDADIETDEINNKYNVPPDSSSVEAEFRYGILKNGNFTNGISEKDYIKFKNFLNDNGYKGINTITRDLIMPNNIRISKDIDGNILEITKKDSVKLKHTKNKISDYKSIYTTSGKYDIRFGIAYEVDMRTVYTDTNNKPQTNRTTSKEYFHPKLL